MSHKHREIRGARVTTQFVTLHLVRAGAPACAWETLAPRDTAGVGATADKDCLPRLHLPHLFSLLVPCDGDVRRGLRHSAKYVVCRVTASGTPLSILTRGSSAAATACSERQDLWLALRTLLVLHDVRLVAPPRIKPFVKA